MKIVYDKVNARVVLVDDSEVCFYTDKFKPNTEYECSDKVIERVVEMFNNGDKLSKIDEYLLDEGECTQEAREIIVNGIYVLLHKSLILITNFLTK